MDVIHGNFKRMYSKLASELKHFNKLKKNLNWKFDNLKNQGQNFIKNLKNTIHLCKKNPYNEEKKMAKKWKKIVVDPCILGQFWVDSRSLNIELSLKLGGFLGRIIHLHFFASFSIKVPMILFHIWLFEAHVEAPTTGYVILAGIF